MNLKFTLLFVLCMITITSVSALTLNDNVEIAWSFDQSSTTNMTVEDNSGNGHNLTINAPINITSAIVNEGHQIYADNSGTGYPYEPISVDFGQNWTICVGGAAENAMSVLSGWLIDFTLTNGPDGQFVLYVEDSEGDYIYAEFLNPVGFDELAVSCAAWDGGSTNESFTAWVNGSQIPFNPAAWDASGVVDYDSSIYDAVYIGANQAGRLSNDAILDDFVLYKNRVLTDIEVQELSDSYYSGDGFPFAALPPPVNYPSNISGIFFFAETAGSGSSTSYDGYFSLSDFGGVATGESFSDGLLNAIIQQITYDGLNVSTIACSPLVYPNENNQPETAVIQVNYTVVDDRGIANESQSTHLELGSNEFPAVCTTTGGSLTRDYVCNVSMQFHYAPGAYDVIVNYTSNNDTVIATLPNSCTYGELVASQRQTSNVGFSDAAPGFSNVRSDEPVILRNTGNVALNLSMTAYHLNGVSTPAVKLLASYFKAGTVLGSAQTLTHDASVDLGVQLTPGASSEEDIYIWLSMPSTIAAQDYTTSQSWVVEASG